MKRFALVFVLWFGWPWPAEAGCSCQCVNGQNVPLCSSPFDLKPLCPPVLCPMALPYTGLQPGGLPPLGSSGCRTVQVLNPMTMMYEARTVCY